MTFMLHISLAVIQLSIDPEFGLAKLHSFLLCLCHSSSSIIFINQKSIEET